MGRSSDELAISDSGQIKANPQTIPLNKILNHIYSDLLKRQGYIPTPRVGRSIPNLKSNQNRQSIDFLSQYLLNHLPASAANFDLNRFKRSSLNDAFFDMNNLNDNNLINKRQFLPPPRIGKKSTTDQFDDDSLTKETLALNQLNSNSIDGGGSTADSASLSNLDNYLQEESNLVEPIDLHTMSKIIKWYQQNKSKQQLIANALGEKRATFSSRLSRSAPLTPRLGRSYWELNNNEEESNEHNDRPTYYESSFPINNRNIRTALTPRIGKRSNFIKTGEKVM